MNRDNVVSFDDFARGRLARRGAQDKLPVAVGASVEVECPRCASVLRIETSRLAAAPEVLCSGCDATIAWREEVVGIRLRRSKTTGSREV